MLLITSLPLYMHIDSTGNGEKTFRRGTPIHDHYGDVRPSSHPHFKTQTRYTIKTDLFYIKPQQRVA